MRNFSAAREIIDANRSKIVLPQVFVVKNEGDAINAAIDRGIPRGFAIRDVEPTALSELLERLDRESSAETVIFNGSLGWTDGGYNGGTYAGFAFMDKVTVSKGKTAIAGGDTTQDAKNARKQGLRVRVSSEPTGGGAFLQLLATGSLSIEPYLSSDLD